MEMLPKCKDILPWLNVLEDLIDPKVLEVPPWLLEPMFGPDRSRISFFEKVGKTMIELQTSESSAHTEIVVYGDLTYRARTTWMLQCLAERHRRQGQQEIVKLEEASSSLHLPSERK
uniref:KH-like RNA-binding domain-containing protein n=1 Tax=Otolemur garnettii TaxID=30611 RepID=H0Y0I3_OTOGA